MPLTKLQKQRAFIQQWIEKREENRATYFSDTVQIDNETWLKHHKCGCWVEGLS